jgi:zinc protease
MARAKRDISRVMSLQERFMSHQIRRTIAATLVFALCGSFAPLKAAPAQDVLRATLPNGLRVVIVRDSLAPVVTEIVNYLVGSQDTPAGFPGMAHAEEHMVAARATRELSANQVSTITTLLGGDFDADTQDSITQYYITTPSDYLDIALKVEAARMRETLDLQSEWTQERGAIEQEVSGDLSSAFYRYYIKARAALFAGTAYDHTGLGTRPSFDKTTGPMLQTFFKHWYAPNNAILVIAGNVDPAATLAQVKSIFGSIPRRAIPAHATINPGPINASEVIKDDSDFPVPFAILTYRMPGQLSKDFAAAHIAMDVLGSPRGNLNALAAEGKALAAGVQFLPSPAGSLAFSYLVTAPGGDTDAALKTLDSVIVDYQKNGVPADLVDASKRREVSQLLFARNSIESLAQDWSEAVAVEGRSSPDDAIAEYNKVTLDDVNRVVRTYLLRDKAVAGILTPKPGSVPGSGGGMGVKDTFTSKDTKPVPLPSWAMRLTAPPSVPASNVKPVDVMLANGIRLIVQPFAISPTVTVRGAIRRNRDLQQPIGKEGVDEILGGLFTYGTTTYDRIAFQKQLDDIAADVTAGASFSLAVPSQGFDRGMQLLADDVLHPALPPNYFAIVQKQSAQTLQGQLTSPDYLAGHALLTARLPKGDPTLREPTQQTIAAVTLDDVKAYHAAVFRPDMTTIVVAGNVTPAQARASVEKWFGTWTATGPKPAVDLPTVPNNAASTVAVTAPGRTQSSVTLAENVGVHRDDPDYNALQLGDSILGGAFYSTRFSRDLRKEGGLVYSIAAGVSAGKTRGVYTVEFGSDPGNVAKARAIIDRDLHDLASKPPNATEMSQAKTQLVRDLSLSEASVSAIASGLVSRASAQEPLDEPTRRAKAILGLTAERVRAAFAKWIDPARFVQVVEGPAK